MADVRENPWYRGLQGAQLDAPVGMHPRHRLPAPIPLGCGEDCAGEGDFVLVGKRILLGRLSDLRVPQVENGVFAERLRGHCGAPVAASKPGMRDG